MLYPHADMLFGNGMETMQMLKGGKRKNREQLQTLKYRLPGGKTKKKKQERHHLHPKIRECRGQNILLLYLKKITTQKLKQHRSSEYFSAIRFIRIDLPFSVLPYIPACRHHPLPEAGSIWTEIQRTICSASQSACSSRSSSRLIHTQKAFTCT